LNSTIGIIGGTVSFLNIFWFAIQTYQGKNPVQNIASWLMWDVIDAIALFITIKAGKPIWLPLSYVLGASSVIVVIIMRGKWRWTGWETSYAIAALLAIAVWLTQKSDIGLLAGAVAINIAGISIYVDMIKAPEPKTFYLWFFTAVAGVITLFGSDWTFGGTVIAWSSIIYNSSLAMVVIRKK
jgi:hypothetical protein